MNREKLSKIKALYYPYKEIKKIFLFAKNLIPDINARRYLKNVQLNKSNHPRIRVGFIVQLPNIWDKLEGVYEELINNENFDVIMIVVPPFDFSTNELSVLNGDNYFLSNYKNAIRAIDENNNLIDIKKLDLDYVFLQRPYDRYLPNGLKSSDLVKFVKICYVPYGYLMSKEYIAMNIDKAFFRNVYLNFATSVDLDKKYRQQFAYNIGKGLQNSVCVSYPEFDLYSNVQHDNSKKVILWTPRWSYDPKFGGSHFFEYVYQIVELKKEFNDIDVVIRPHPLMFENFIKTGLLTQKQVIEMKSMFAENAIEISENRSLKQDLLSTDILITDYSSLIAPFYMTGRPIIYCESNSSDWVTETREMANTFYTCSSWDMIHLQLTRLLSDHDEKKQQRDSLIRKLNVGQGAYEVVDHILKDYRSK